MLKRPAVKLDIKSPSKKVVVNARFLTQQLTGVQRYAIEIARRLKCLDNSICFVAPQNIIHLDIAKELQVEIIGQRIGYFWEQFELPAYLRRIGSPLLFNPCNMAPMSYPNNLITLHDIAFVKYPSDFRWFFRLIYRCLIPSLLKTSKKIITVSQFAKNEIIDCYQIDKNKLAVIYHGVSQFFRKKPPALQGEQYILAVSSLTNRKNLAVLIEAFLELNDNATKLYVIGERNSVFIRTNLTNNQNIKFLDRVTDDDLVSAYSNALFFVYPSLYEGFGMPPLEAMACGTPVIVSNRTAMPEICGSAAIYVNPNDPREICNNMKELLEKQQIRETLRQKGLKHVMNFSWDNSARQHLQLINKILNG